MKPNLQAFLLLASIFAGTAARADTYYVSCFATNVIEQFAPDGTDLGPFPATGLKNPQGMLFDAQGNLLVACNGNNSIEKYSPTGTHLGTFAHTGLGTPVSLIYDSAGNIYASNNSSGTVEKFSPTGTDLGIFATAGSHPWGLVFDSNGNLYVSNQGGTTVQKFSSTGANLGTFVSANISQPTGLAFDLTGNLYVANQGSNTVQIYSPAGVNLGHLNVAGLSGPAGLFFDSGGNLYICANTSATRKVSPAGVDLGVFATTTAGVPGFVLVRSGAVAPSITGQPANLTTQSPNAAIFSVTANGVNLTYQWQKNGVNLADGGTVSGSTSSNLQIASPNGNDVGQYRAIVSNSGGAVASNSASLIVLASIPAPVGTLYISCFATNIIEEFAPDGTDLGEFPASGSLKNPQGMLFDSQDNLLVACNGNNSIEKYSPTGTHLGTFAHTGLSTPVSLIYDSVGNIYASNNSSGTVEKFSPTGTDLGVFATPGNQPWGLVFDSSGNLYVSTQFGNTVQKYSPTGANLGTFVSANVSQPTGLAFDLTGNLYVANQGSNTVQIYSPTGVNLGHLAVSGISQPAGLFFDSGGNLFICANTSATRKVSPAGVDLGAFATTTAGVPGFVVVQPISPVANITTQPTPVTVVVGANATFTIVSSGNPVPAIQWQLSTDGGSTWGNLSDGGNVSGSANLTLTLGNTTVLMSGNQFRAVATNVFNSAISNAVTLTVHAVPFITTDPGNQTAITGNATSFTAAASGFPTPGFQWQISTDGGVTWANLTDGGNISGSATATLSLSNTTAALNGNQFRALAINVAGTGTTTPAILAVQFPPQITTQPIDFALISGNTAAFNVVASGNPSPAFLWQLSTDGGTTWGNLADDGNVTGSATANLSVANTTAAMLGNQFRAVATNTLGFDTSTAANLTVNSAPAITTQPANQTVITGNTATFTAAASGFPAPVFQWQIYIGGNDTPWANLTDGGDISGSATATLSLSNTTNALNGSQYRALASNFVDTAATDTVTLTVLVPAQITTQPVNAVVLSGNSATFTVTVTGNPAPGFQWYFNKKLVASNGTSSTLIIANVTSASVGNYTVVVANGIGSPVTSAIATLALGVSPKVTTSPASVTVTVGQSASFKVAASGTLPPTFQWQISTDGGNGWSNLTEGSGFSGVTSSNLMVNNTTIDQSADQFRALAINAFGTVSSKAATLTIDSPASVTGLSASSGNSTVNNSGNLTVSANSSVTFSVAATGNALKYQWQLNGKNISGATKATYTIAKAGAASDGNYTVSVSNPLNPKPTSAGPFTLSVLTPPVIVTPLKATLAKVGTGTTFKVVASGNPIPVFTWSFGGGGLPSSNITTTTNNNTVTSILGFANVTAAYTGTYKVVIINSQSPTPPLSSSAKLTVIK
jgi:predicted secreted protein